MAQLTFSGLSSCQEFDPNVFAKQKCRGCGAQLRDHKESAIKDWEHVRAAIQADQKVSPATLILRDEKTGGELWQGGFMACKSKFVKAHNIAYVVNTAKDLDKFFVAWGKNHLPKVVKLGVEILRLNWVDAEDQRLYKETKYDQLMESSRGIHKFLSQGKSVLVHCAQGKSRSSAVTVAYLMARDKADAKKSLEYLKSKRSMAQPNNFFMKQLCEYEGSKELEELRRELLAGEGKSGFAQ
mmetsp:Transcript_12271/g.17070  ORF Transcript_12271/g.17070 Transcript_12271/m.17070 type:complete len:240 (+) Transcript_12271:74-793(+)